MLINSTPANPGFYFVGFCCFKVKKILNTSYAVSLWVYEYSDWSKNWLWCKGHLLKFCLGHQISQAFSKHICVFLDIKLIAETEGLYFGQAERDYMTSHIHIHLWCNVHGIERKIPAQKPPKSQLASRNTTYCALCSLKLHCCRLIQFFAPKKKKKKNHISSSFKIQAIIIKIQTILFK